MSSNARNQARPIDHCVLPTASLASARARFAALGFCVAPDGIHPFGTKNCCVYLADGTFLEPLAIDDAAKAATAARSGNVFVARDRNFRERNGAEGFSAIVFGTDDAAVDHEDFVGANVSAGSILEFSRPFLDASGNSDTASFRLAFAANAKDDVFFFTCERINAPDVDRSALQNHANSVTGLKAVVLAADDPENAARFVRSIAGADLNVGGTVDLANAAVLVLDPAGFEAQFGIAPAGREGLTFAAIVFATQDLAGAEALFNTANIAYQKRDNRLVVPATTGQGAAFIFEAPE